LKPHLAGYWSKWRDGTNLKTSLSDRTFYRVRRELLREVGIDIASPAPKRRAEVELPVRVIEPKRLPSDYVPEWAVGTALFADPSQQPMRLRHVV
jgi:II/X family phage/plasmid replication protein